MFRLVALICLLAGSAAAETVVATRTIRPQELISAADIRVDPGTIEGAFQNPNLVVGQEARYAIYPGRPVMRGTVGAPALIERNQLVEIIYANSGLRIMAEGRALSRGGLGDRVRVMNTASRTVLFGTITENGTILVSK
jgi:flagella basal body P-ring formation protein FlgA